MIKAVAITVLFLASFAGRSLAQDSDADRLRRDAAPTGHAKSAPVPPSANANAPKAPALPEEPHGAGSVYDELKASGNKRGE